MAPERQVLPMLVPCVRGFDVNGMKKREHMSGSGELENYQRELLAEEYEKLVEDMCIDLARGVFSGDLAGVGPVTIRRQCGHRGKSGHEHIVDVSVELFVAGIRFLIVVECKRYQRPVGIEDLLEFASRLEDMSAHKGVLVTTTGFQPGAVKIAESKGIGLIIYNKGERITVAGVSHGGSGWWIIGRYFFDALMQVKHEEFSGVLLTIIPRGE